MAQSFSTDVEVRTTPDEAFAAITRPHVWWNPEIEGRSETAGDEFGFDMPGLHQTRLRVTEAIPGRRMVWHVLENHFSFVEDQEEWVGTDIVFDVASNAEGGVTITLTHVGLVPELECHNVCSGAWTDLVGTSLRNMLTSA
ncbi:hypothetical protein Kfla_4537 [Kribbella flavida DSM 17836]|uniref:Activator of Hsp90 ATPase 1 family protein n=1 Tax=Kribbella flavida (strain DSM 17836 / JCM 10339 / NBRC 14399) TaxID=479435 RepID=D2PXV7_KRIFD|nr:hypothetical protein [Kribbella flavida]ADB33563.1 hypothetical protein Kfla_4537 [Kribbella flavida DSM 17836]